MQSSSTPANAGPHLHRGLWLLIIATAGVPISLLWDFSWESTVGIDRFWSPPHGLTYVVMALAALGAVALMSRTKPAAAVEDGSVRLGRWGAPLGAWLVLWSALAFATAVLFDRWWQSAYGLGAGIWHPPQMLKAIAFFAVLLGVWLFALAAPQGCAGDANAAAMQSCVAGGLTLALIHIVTLQLSYPNYQHSASFYKTTCATYPLVLVALAKSGRWRWSATAGATVYAAVFGGMVWLLPLFPAQPQVGPIYHQLDHLMPPPFPLLLIVPALAVDLLVKKLHWPERRVVGWLQAIALGLAFFLCFLLAQWMFAEFLLKPAADNWFFAGGGKHWPFFLKISPPARVMFWDAPPDQLDGRNALVVLGLSMLAARLGLWLGAWMGRVKR